MKHLENNLKIHETARFGPKVLNILKTKFEQPAHASKFSACNHLTVAALLSWIESGNVCDELRHLVLVLQHGHGAVHVA